MTPNEYCRSKAAADGSSLHYCLLYVEVPKRQGVIALHALRKELFEIVDRCIEIEPARAKMQWWRGEITAAHGRTATHPVARALSETLDHFPLAEEQVLEMVEGFDNDLDQGRYDDFKALQLYCHRVSSIVYLLSAEILGYTNRQTLRFAHELGLALQLIDFIRNAGLHARQGRIYVPLDELVRRGVTEDEILHGKNSPAIVALLAQQDERAREHLAKALTLLPDEDRKSQRPLLALAAMALALLNEIRRDGYMVLDQGQSLTPLRKLWLATRTWLFT